MIAMTDLHDLIDVPKFIYMDVGGGSNGITLYANGNPVESRSFKIGTVFKLHDMVKRAVDRGREMG
jgi:exopolyphosphatase/guanosine-5'-triphosphate,3'-diphosphate pyrophosphatase